MNSLNSTFMEKLADELKNADQNETVNAIIITGLDRCFSIGADISELSSKSFHELVHDDALKDWDVIPNIRKPIIAAVNG
ncbi:unnamed protein product [Caenorhabditis bovis]|uniref:Enoyl-CoA hydratase n=1 Tax=Caenorhabditis bovis TaxID=2654633 RepID=A0A8S1E8C1_9PELO|nr:unnamed protein product [Caenorhabditis bovis]